MSTKPLLAALLFVSSLGFLNSTASAQEARFRATAQIGSAHVGVSYGSPDRGRSYGGSHRRPARIGERHGFRRTWVPGHYETVQRRVWVPGRTERVWIEPVFEIRYDACGNAFRFQVCAGYFDTVRTPGCYETRRVRIWVAGCYASRRY